MSYLFRLVCATVLVLASTMSTLHAAPACSSVAAKRQVATAVPSNLPAAEPRGGTQACAKNCQIAGLPGGDLAVILPGPTHLPVVSAPDEVAAWHAEIFEQLEAVRAGPEPTQYCKLDL